MGDLLEVAKSSLASLAEFLCEDEIDVEPIKPLDPLWELLEIAGTSGRLVGIAGVAETVPNCCNAALLIIKKIERAYSLNKWQTKTMKPTGRSLRRLRRERREKEVSIGPVSTTAVSRAERLHEWLCFLRWALHTFKEEFHTAEVGILKKARIDWRIVSFTTEENVPSWEQPPARSAPNCPSKQAEHVELLLSMQIPWLSARAELQARGAKFNSSSNTRATRESWVVKRNT